MNQTYRLFDLHAMESRTPKSYSRKTPRAKAHEIKLHMFDFIGLDP